MRPIELTLNGTRVRTTVEPHETLLGVLRQRLAATEVKSGCERGDCGACAVLLDGRPVSTRAWRWPCRRRPRGHDGARAGDAGGPAPAPGAAFVSYGAAQCGICIAGDAGHALRVPRGTPRPSARGDPRARIERQLCRCTGYTRSWTPRSRPPDAGRTRSRPERAVSGGAAAPSTPGRRRLPRSSGRRVPARRAGQGPAAHALRRRLRAGRHAPRAGAPLPAILGADRQARHHARAAAMPGVAARADRARRAAQRPLQRRPRPDHDGGPAAGPDPGARRGARALPG